MGRVLEPVSCIGPRQGSTLDELPARLRDQFKCFGGSFCGAWSFILGRVFWDVGLKNINCCTSIVLSTIIYIHICLFVDNFQVTDDKNVRRQIILTTFRKEKKAMVYVACLPLILSATWDCIKINLVKVTRDLFRAKYVETVKIQVSVGRFDKKKKSTSTRFHSGTLHPIAAPLPPDSSKLSNTKSVFHRQTLLEWRAAKWL